MTIFVIFHYRMTRFLCNLKINTVDYTKITETGGQWRCNITIDQEKFFLLRCNSVKNIYANKNILWNLDCARYLILLKYTQYFEFGNCPLAKSLALINVNKFQTIGPEQENQPLKMWKKIFSKLLFIFSQDLENELTIRECM